MEEIDLAKRISSLKDKLNRALRRVEGLKEKAKCLEMQYEDARGREHHTNELVMELLERQRELNVMLNRANIMLNRTQETMALTSMEFNEMAKALPEPKKAEWSERVTRINELFKKSGIQDAEVSALESTNPAAGESFAKDEMKKESEQAFGRKETIWARKEQREPPRVEAEIVEEEQPAEETKMKLVAEDAPAPIEEPKASAHEDSPEMKVGAKARAESLFAHQGATTESAAQADNEGREDFAPRRRTWWQRQAS